MRDPNRSFIGLPALHRYISILVPHRTLPFLAAWQAADRAAGGTVGTVLVQ